MKIPETSSELQSLLDNRSYSGDHFVFPPRFRSDLTSLLESSFKLYISEDGFRLKRRIELSLGAVPSALPKKLSVVVSLQPTKSSPLVALEINSATFTSCIPSTYSEALYRITIENRSFVLFKAPLEGDFQPFEFRSKHKAYRSNVDNLLLSSGVQVDWKTKTCVPLWNSTGRLEQINPYFKEKEVGGQEDSNNSVSSLRYSLSVLPDFLFPKDWNQTEEDEPRFDNAILMPDNGESPNNDAILNTEEVSEYPTDIITNDSSIIPGKALSEMVETFHKPKESRVDKMLIKLEAYLVSNFFNEARQCQDSLLWYRRAPNQPEWGLCTSDAARKISDKHARKFFTQNFVRDSVAELSEMNKEAWKVVCRAEIGFQSSPLGVCFSNGFLCYNTMELQNTDFHWGVFMSIRAPYPSVASLSDLPSRNFFKVMSRLLVTTYDICLYRVLFCRALIRMPGLQTGFCINGKPGTGKGVLLRVLRKMIGTNNVVAITLKDLGNEFSRQKLVNASVLVLNEVDNIDSAGAHLIQALLGRDVVTFTEKHKQGVHEFTFNGTIVLSSNKSPSQLFRNAPALVDRFVTITHSPRLSQPDATLEEQLEKEMVAISHWAVATPRVFLNQFVRTGVMNYELANETNHLERFVLEN